MAKNKRGAWAHEESLRLQAELPDPNPSGLCLCGCGRETAIAKVTMQARSWVRGKHVRYCHGHSRRTQSNPLEKLMLEHVSNVRRRQLRLHWTDGTHSDEEITALYATQGGLCAYCHTEIATGWHEDHRQPLSRGGRDDIANIALSCSHCNRRKWIRTEAEFIDYLEHGPRPENMPSDFEEAMAEVLRRRLATQSDPRWSRAHPLLEGCTGCERSDLSHFADGLCRPCWNARRTEQRRAARGTTWMKKAPFHACCQRCKSAERKHYGKGYCQPCYMHLFYTGAIPLTGKRSIPATEKRSKT